MNCRVGCGACCIAPSISSPLPGMPHGKPAGVRCIHLTWDNRCQLFGKPERPAVCTRLQPSEDMCGHSTRQAFVRLSSLERATRFLNSTKPSISYEALESFRNFEIKTYRNISQCKRFQSGTFKNEEV